ncbi:Coagulation factor 5 8 type domain-containing protein [Pleurostoma richardsiae]|uniref:Coagulation factor 5 8 type domain-containing protein n=1 Tax=Pleurostoma richardsiae TaxID=41990 RepID=A0AA38RN48_9PEZI|nr:Coagulation factor 5 8 type domain-containing protein [Pleurostoma richardsiae]
MRVPLSPFLLKLAVTLGLGGAVFGLPAVDPSGGEFSSHAVQLPRVYGAVQGTSLNARAAQTYTSIPNGQIWNDVSGNMIGAWGGNVYKEDSTYYWIGQNTPGSASLSTGTALVNMYKSTDLMNWQKVGAVITVYTPDVNGNQLLTYCHFERPKLMKSKSTGKYVIWAHWEVKNSYSASEVLVATADKIEGPYTVTSKGHHRPGAGNNVASAMGDRVGGLRLDFSTAAKASGDTSHPYMPVQHSYPPAITQYGTPATTSPYDPAYVVASQYGTFTLSSVIFNTTLKAIAVVMTPWNASLYDEYGSTYSVSASTYIVRYPTQERSAVAEAVFAMGEPGSERSALVTPVIAPTLNESKSETVVLMKTGDAAFITVSTENATIYYTTDGSTPVRTNSTQKYTPGTRISVSGAAGTRLTVKAIAVKSCKSSAVVTQTYEIAENESDVPVFKPVINYPSGTYTPNSASLQTGTIRVYSPSYMTNCYYTLDGLDPDPPVLGDNIGYGSRDQTVWEDPKTGTHYQISATDNIYGRIWQLADDLTDVVAEKEYDYFVDESREAATLVRNGGTAGEYVYLITSGQSGWYANQAMYKRTKDIDAGFSLPRDSKTGYRNGTSEWSALAPVGDASTFGSQPTWIQNVGTDEDPAYIYIGDRYNASGLEQSSYIFTPIYVDDDTAGENGVLGSGNMTLVFNPLPAINVAEDRVDSPCWKLLSLNKPVTSTSATALTSAQAAAGTYNFSAAVANDGVDYDVNAYDAVAQYYLPSAVPYFWQVDLGDSYGLSWIGLSFRSVSGSDSVERYLLSGSVDGETWTQLVDNTANILPGYKSHLIDGTYRYVRLNTTSVWDVVHNQAATWQAGLYELSVYGDC